MSYKNFTLTTMPMAWRWSPGTCGQVDECLHRRGDGRDRGDLRGDRCRSRRQGRGLHLRQGRLLGRRRSHHDQGHVRVHDGREGPRSRPCGGKGLPPCRPHGLAVAQDRDLRQAWVAAINGTCMGGATELAMACHARVAANSKAVKIGLPEVKVGIFPVPAARSACRGWSTRRMLCRS